jgi:phage FluMu protein Com
MSRAEDQCPECGEQRIQGICWRCKPMEKTVREEELEAQLEKARDARLEERMIAKELWKALNHILLGWDVHEADTAVKVRDKYRERFEK